MGNARSLVSLLMTTAASTLPVSISRSRWAATLTSEPSRRAMDTLKRASETGVPPPPALPRALALLTGGPPAQPAEHAARRLRSAGLTAGSLHPIAVLAAARLFDFESGFAPRGPDPGATVIAAGHLPAYDGPSASF